MTTHKAVHTGPEDSSNSDLKLGRRLTYILRYGAEKEGLRVLDGGYVDLKELLKVPLLRHNDQNQILRLVETSYSAMDRKRYQQKALNGTIYIRALYGRRMERNPCHEGTKVTRLLEICITQICKRLQDYDMQNFPDEFLLTTIMHRLRQMKRLTNNAFRTILSPTIEHLDLGAVYVTDVTLKLVGTRCPHLKLLNLRDCGYIINDHVLCMLLKKEPELETLNLSGCHNLTDKTLDVICKYNPAIMHLNMNQVPNLTQEGILRLVTTCNRLVHIDVFDNRNFSDEGGEVLHGIGEARGMSVLLNGWSYEQPSSNDASLMVSLASVFNYW